MEERKDENVSIAPSGVSRRGFLGTVATGLTAGPLLAGDASVHAAAPECESGESQTLEITLHVNGGKHSLHVEPRWTLLYALHDVLGLTATKPGCERGECGACTVLIDGVTRYACMTLAVEAVGAQITTLEGLMQGENIGPVQRAFIEEDALQCGFCTSGQVMAVEGLLRGNPEPSLDQIRAGVSGNLCRCGSYAHIFKAAQRASKLKIKGAI
ncbi:MAG: (2Fe-2S)-binding protein [Bryobacteraceae bacterium]